VRQAIRDGVFTMIRKCFAALFAGLAVLFAAAFYDRYWRWRDCFNELGRCYDPKTQDVYLEQAGVAWGSLALICLALATALLIRSHRR
jgi:hypothetical protein